MIVEEREYARLLGYPWGKPLEGDVRECAEKAADWYRRHGKPRVYCQTLETETITAITAGTEADEEVERLWESGRVDEAYFLDRYAAAVVEKLAADLGPHRSPGTGDLPFEEQQRFFSYLAPLAPEITILSSGMLKPKNSLLAVGAVSTGNWGRNGEIWGRRPNSEVQEFGLRPQISPFRPQFPVETAPTVGCIRCDLRGCTFRRKSA